MYKIIWQLKAVKQLEKFTDQKIKLKIFSAVDSLKDFPDCRNIKALKNHTYNFRLRAGKFRIFFDVQNVVKIISIEEIKKRDEQTY